jgi:hypothetical protein
MPEEGVSRTARPKHGSWLNVAKNEISIMGLQCLNRRLGGRGLMAEEVAAWQGGAMPWSRRSIGRSRCQRRAANSADFTR